MPEVNMEWISGSEIMGAHAGLPVRQVYVWYFTSDNKFLIVSKDGEKWQLPGGKPDSGESLAETATREMLEETGLDISLYNDSLKLFGYYVISETDEGITDKYLQVRMRTTSSDASSDLSLSVENEDGAQEVEDQILYVRTVTKDEAAALIPWLSKSGEYLALQSLGML